jgi:hypothetical protein
MTHASQKNAKTCLSPLTQQSIANVYPLIRGSNPIVPSAYSHHSSQLILALPSNRGTTVQKVRYRNGQPCF